MTSHDTPADLPTKMPDLDTRACTIRGLLDPSTCEELIAYAKARMTPVVPPHGGGHVYACPLNRGDLADLPGFDILGHAILTAHQALGYNLELDIARYGINTYLAPGDSMGRHVDDEERTPDRTRWDVPHRGISASVQLSTPRDYEGGRLYLLNQEDPERWITAPQGQGDAVMFGSSIPHGVSAVTAGTRHVLLAWFYTHHDLRRIT